MSHRHLRLLGRAAGLFLANASSSACTSEVLRTERTPTPHPQVFPPLPASALVAAVYAVLTLVLPRACALPLFAGMGYGYVAYDCLHYAIHHCRAGRSIMGMPVLRELQRRHMHHHYRYGCVHVCPKSHVRTC